MTTPQDQPAPTDEEVAARAFYDWFRRIDGGRPLQELTDLMREANSAAMDTGSKAVLGLTITVTPLKGSNSTVTVSAAVSKKLPRRPAATTIFYVDDHHDLRDDDPRQQALPGILAAVQDHRTAPQPLAAPAATPIASAQ